MSSTATTTKAPALDTNSDATTVDTRPSLPRRSSSLHKMVIAKLRPLPFQYLWSVWHSKPGDRNEYLLTMLVDHVADIGAFYRIFNNVPWNGVKQRDSIHIFRSGVKPLWEDPENRQGGRWLIRVRPEYGRDVRVWEEICLLCCGGELQAAIAQERDHVLGMSFSPRLYFTHISIWTKKGDNLRSIMLLERAILGGLSPDLRPKSNIEFNYRKHSEKIGFNLQSRQNQLPLIPSTGLMNRPMTVRALTAS
ncbi:uncharacterized protein Z518_03149 [Rhinocladiella mackenziei CBS 650.93]|uniref:Translation initiation factor eIF4E n=1 Tax=Rhinocladiella mackenziei CBS 650.93 TaxID=1442369 RepID=A0A0D2HDD3_9EURO|nr:uncharacterized protein Z518_03149 [Rhinocladiella mackenziei CBS 650.93]KIX08493.1 hypothetical protein Z518_03149 [Rhinocladiella mackenziei CBS 650.93]